ncbi:MAG: hypothetical protein ACRDVM_02340 [Acidimicrobiia bacterium]
MGPIWEAVRAEIGRLYRDEGGLNTAELLGNAALAIVALLAIWAALEALGLEVVGWIRQSVLGGGGGA